MDDSSLDIIGIIIACYFVSKPQVMHSFCFFEILIRLIRIASALWESNYPFYPQIYILSKILTYILIADIAGSEAARSRAGTISQVPERSLGWKAHVPSNRQL